MGYYNNCLVLVCLLNLQALVRSRDTTLETYIVHVELPKTPILGPHTQDLQSWYQTFLLTTSSSSMDEPPSILYSYRNVFNGFAARLSPQQVNGMEKLPGFISARPQKMLPLQTTRSPNFLGLNQNMGLWRDSNYGRGVIIGVIDSGITPDHPSFNDEGMPPVPARWRGVCQFNDTNACNNKIIGARYYSIGNGTPYDESGHGTGTASTAAGNFVRGANVFGNANGTASGTAPLAHIASYKVCSTLVDCSESDILAAIEDAIHDGVHIISLSLAAPLQEMNFYDDPIAAGTFKAMEKGIFVSAAAGNNGPALGTVRNSAPWILTVGASSIDRKLRATAVLGNNETLLGESTFQPADFPSSQLPLIFPGMNSNNTNASQCFLDALINIDVRGKIVVCQYELMAGMERIAKGQAVKEAGGAAMIMINQKRQGSTTYSDSHVLPATHLSYGNGLKVLTYLNSTSSPMATITFQGTQIGDNHAPQVAEFSARGPNPASPNILKPDIIGPGHNILAPWPVSVENNTNTRSIFIMGSGTSVSCPHLSGVAALIKNTHPTWSPAAIKSALMTTAGQVNLAGNPIRDETDRPASLLAMGAGHVNPLRATNPGLVYDIHSEDYVRYLCGLRYTDQQVEIILKQAVSCAKIQAISEQELNYPSLFVTLGNSSQTYNRTVTNVGEANSTYTVEIGGLPGADLRVEPKTLQFTGLNQSLTYQVTFSRLGSARTNTMVEGFLTWNSAKYQVRSPIVVSFL